MIKKIRNIMLLLLVAVTSLFGVTNVEAVATRGDIVSGKYVNGPYYVIHDKGDGHKMWLQAQFIIRTSDGDFVYCVQPYVTIKEDNTYSVTTDNNFTLNANNFLVYSNLGNYPTLDERSVIYEFSSLVILAVIALCALLRPLFSFVYRIRSN